MSPQIWTWRASLLLVLVWPSAHINQMSMTSSSLRTKPITSCPEFTWPGSPKSPRRNSASASWAAGTVKHSWSLRSITVMKSTTSLRQKSTQASSVQNKQREKTVKRVESSGTDFTLRYSASLMPIIERTCSVSPKWNVAKLSETDTQHYFCDHSVHDEVLLNFYGSAGRTVFRSALVDRQNTNTCILICSEVKLVTFTPIQEKSCWGMLLK